MIPCEHYQTYEGPKLVKAMLGEDDITDKMTDMYGTGKNWNGCLWTFKESFGPDSYGKNYRLEFQGEDGRKHWFHGFISDIDQYFNPPQAS